MKNFVFVSPHFPKTYYQFTRALKNAGFNVLGIADTDYSNLSNELKNSLTDYYQVGSMENYDEMFKAVAYFESRYGHIDFLESNNEYWLSEDARLRTDFNITTGKNAKNIKMFQSKELEKKYYALAGVKTARYVIPSSLRKAKDFIREVGYPVIVKPNKGVGAAKTYKINDEKELSAFFEDIPSVKYIMEEFVNGDLISFDGVSNSKSEPVFYSNEVFPNQIMDVVNGGSDVYYYSNITCPDDLKDVGTRVLKAFKAVYRFFHLEFFRLREDKLGLGKKGELIGLEVNMRAPGGYTPDIIDFSKSVDIYKIWAEVMMNDKTTEKLNRKKYYAVYCGRRNGKTYALSSLDIVKKYQDKLAMHDVMPPVLSDALGNEFFVAKLDTIEELEAFKNEVLKKRE